MLTIFVKVDENLMKSQQAAYSVAGVDEEVGYSTGLTAFITSFSA
jgi:hypothetical protein